MERTLAVLRRRIREELRAEGPDGGGYSDFFIDEQINTAIGLLAEQFPIRDNYEFLTEEEVNEYELEDVVESDVINIMRLDYDETALNPRDLTDYNQETFNEGEVRYWFLWGSTLLLSGEVEDDKEVKIWVSRTPKKVSEDDDVPEIPEYADEAIAQYAVASCYRESLDYERASQHFRNFLHVEDRLKRRAIPQTERASPTHMRSFYFPPTSGRRGRLKSDDNPSGELR